MFRSFAHRILFAPYVAMPCLVKPRDMSPIVLPAVSFDMEHGIPGVFTGPQLQLHYLKHHKAYVDKMNAILNKDAHCGDTIESIARGALQAKQAVLFNQAAQHFNHTFYWACLAPVAAEPTQNLPGGDLQNQIIKDFKSVETFMTAFEEAALGNFGSGWTWLVWSQATKALSIVNTSNAAAPHLVSVGTEHEDSVSRTQCPILTVDVWEHAYYKDYENRRAEYLKSFWRIVDWKSVGTNWERAMSA